MTTLFFDKNDPLLDFMEPGTTINFDRYLDTLIKLHTTIKIRIRGLLTRKPILLHDNAKPHMAQQTWSLIKNFVGKQLNIHLTALIFPPRLFYFRQDEDCITRTRVSFECRSQNSSAKLGFISWR